MSERWLPVPGLSGHEASDLGWVRSLRRSAASRPRILTGTVGPCGFPTLTLSPILGDRSHRIGSVVALAFLGPRPDRAEVRYLDADPFNTRLDNLAYGTLEEILADHAARVAREEAAGAPTHCGEGHRYAPHFLGNWCERYCHPCKLAENRRRYRARRQTRGRVTRPPAQPRVSQCVACGTDVLSARTGPLAARCPAHKRVAQREAGRRHDAKRRTKP